MAGKTVLILAGGVGGLVTANELRQRLDREHRVVLVDREGRHIFWPSPLLLQVGPRKPESIVRGPALLAKKGFEVVKGWWIGLTRRPAWYRFRDERGSPIAGRLSGGCQGAAP